MLLFIVFGIYVIVKKQIHITRSWTLTGDNATTFGVVLVVVPILVSMFSRKVLPSVVPSAILYHPIGGRLIVYALITVGLLVFAFLLRDKKSPLGN